MRLGEKKIFLKNVRLEVIWRENLKFLKSEKPNSLGLVWVRLGEKKIFLTNVRLDVIWRENLKILKSEKPNSLGLVWVRLGEKKFFLKNVRIDRQTCCGNSRAYKKLKMSKKFQEM